MHQMLGASTCLFILSKRADRSNETVVRFIDELIDYTERWARREIGALADGEYRATGYLDDDGISDEPIRLVLKAEIRMFHASPFRKH